MTESEYAALVEAQVGDRYVLGAEASPTDHDPDVYDCHELVEWSYRHGLGVVLNGPACEQYRNTVPAIGGYRVGDLVFLANNPLRYKRIGHVGIITRVGPTAAATGIVEAKGRAYGVVKSNLAVWLSKPTFAGVRRFPAFTAAIKPNAPAPIIPAAAKPYTWVWVWSGDPAQVNAWRVKCAGRLQVSAARTSPHGVRVGLAHCGKRAALVMQDARALGLIVRSEPTSDGLLSLNAKLKAIASTK